MFSNILYRAACIVTAPLFVLAIIAVVFNKHDLAHVVVPGLTVVGVVLLLSSFFPSQDSADHSDSDAVNVDEVLSRLGDPAQFKDKDGTVVFLPILSALLDRIEVLEQNGAGKEG